MYIPYTGTKSRDLPDLDPKRINLRGISKKRDKRRKRVNSFETKWTK